MSIRKTQNCSPARVPVSCAGDQPLALPAVSRCQIVVALREIAAGLVDYDVIAQDDIVEEEPLFAAFEEEANEPL